MAKSNKVGYQRLVEDGGRCDTTKAVARFCFTREAFHMYAHLVLSYCPLKIVILSLKMAM